MSLGDRLRRLDEWSGAHEYAHSRAEFFAPFWLVGLLVLVVLAVVRKDGALGLFVAVAAVGYSPFLYVGFRHRRDRKRSGDKWHEPW
jgi:Flp pilus assembly protein TadB